MAKPLWVQVPGPTGRLTTVQLGPEWLALAREDYEAELEEIRAAVKEAGWQLCQAWKPGRKPYSQAVRDRAEEDLQRAARELAAQS